MVPFALASMVPAVPLPVSPIDTLPFTRNTTGKAPVSVMVAPLLTVSAESLIASTLGPPLVFCEVMHATVPAAAQELVFTVMAEPPQVFGTVAPVPFASEPLLMVIFEVQVHAGAMLKSSAAVSMLLANVPEAASGLSGYSGLRLNSESVCAPVVPAALISTLAFEARLNEKNASPPFAVEHTPAPVSKTVPGTSYVVLGTPL